jgi:hypothetical protein
MVAAEQCVLAIVRDNYLPIERYVRQNRPIALCNDRFASIRAFVSVAASGGFSSAGGRLNQSKATVSDQVQALGNGLGVRLESHQPAGQPD